MADITAAMVKSLREKTGLPMMECKKALVNSNGDEEAAQQWLRESNVKTQETRLGRDTSEGRMAAYTGEGVGTLIELQCESAPVTNNDDFIQLANDLAQQLATGPGAATADELLAQPSPSNADLTLQAQKDDLFNRIREVFNVGRIVRYDGNCASYIHHDGSFGVLVQYEGDNADLARDIAMHICAKQPKVVSTDQVDPAEVEKERSILAEAARKEGKPDNIIEKMIEGRMRVFYEASVLNEQIFIKDEKQTVAKVAEAGGLKVVQFACWKMEKSAEE